MFMGPRNWCQGMNSASLCSLAGRYENPIPPRCLAPIDFLKIPALVSSENLMSTAIRQHAKADNLYSNTSWDFGSFYSEKKAKSYHYYCRWRPLCFPLIYKQIAELNSELSLSGVLFLWYKVTKPLPGSILSPVSEQHLKIEWDIRYVKKRIDKIWKFDSLINISYTGTHNLTKSLSACS